MAKAHTGHLTGSDAVVSAVFRQYGVQRVDGLDQLLEVSAALARTKPPSAAALRRLARGAGGRVCVYSISGGTGAHMADLVAAAGLELPSLTKSSQTAAARVDPALPAGVQPGRQRWRPGARLAWAQDHRDDAGRPQRRPAAVPHHRRPALHGQQAVRGPGGGRRHDRQAGLRGLGFAGRRPRRPTARRCSRARCRPSAPSPTPSWRPRPTSTTTASSPPTSRRSPSPPSGQSPARATAMPPARAEWACGDRRRGAVRAGLQGAAAAYGIAVPKERWSTSAGAAAKAAKHIGYPVVMKIVSADIPHKSDLGLVAVGVRDEDDARRTYKRLRGRGQEGRAQGERRRGAGGRDGPGRRDGGRHRPRRPLRPRRHVRPGRRLHRGAERRDLPGPAVHHARRPGHAGRAAPAPPCCAACGASRRPTAVPWSTCS